MAAGVTVVAAGGDSGTVGASAGDPEVIGVGASTSFRLAAQAYGYPQWASDNISALSSGGTTQGNKVVDLVAPGMVGVAACTVDPHWKGCTLPTQVLVHRPTGGRGHGARLARRHDPDDRQLGEGVDR
ncbi:hypothetical protein ABT147_35635 [Streptomyces sp. NPDC001868]|uniref:hypothetical protein n=1 Tax=Streptomyces sp. NPDC001868 TaxID=3154401 RepID=UPI003325C3E1